MLTFSNSRMWTSCPASVHPVQGIHQPNLTPQQDDARKEGTAADWLANMVLAGDAATAEEGAGEIAPNGWPIDATMVRHVQEYIDIVTRHGVPHPQTDTTLFNGRVTGRPDNHTVSTDVLHVYELKYGYKIVEPYANSQLLLGAIAFRQPHHRMFSLEVFQPRPHHPNGKHRKWVVSADELVEWEAWLSRCVDAVYIDKPVAAPGDQCGYCLRRAGCHALMANIYAAFETITSNYHARPLSAADLGLELKFLETLDKMLKARWSGTTAEALARAKKGEFVPGWTLEENYGDRKWDTSPEIRQMLTGIDPYKQVERSPAEIEKEGGNVDPMTSRPFVGMKLKPFNQKAVERKFRT